MTNQRSDIKLLLERLFPVWDKLDDTQRELLANAAKPKSYQAGERIHGGSNDCVGVLLIARGILRVYSLSEEGREITLFRVGEGESCMLSASCVLPLITFDVFIDAQTNVDILMVPSPDFQALSQQNPYVEAFAYRQVAQRFSEVMWVMQQVLFVSFDKRLAAYLITEASTQKSPRIKTTHDQIARDLGSAREVVSRMLKYFEREGLVKLDRGTVTIINEKGLGAIAREE